MGASTKSPTEAHPFAWSIHGRMGPLRRFAVDVVDASRWSDDLGLFLVDIAAADSETGAGTFRPQDGLIYS